MHTPLSVHLSIYSHRGHTRAINIFHFPEQPPKPHTPPSANVLRDIFLTIAIELCTVLKMWVCIYVFLNNGKLQSDLKLITHQWLWRWLWNQCAINENHRSRFKISTSTIPVSVTNRLCANADNKFIQGGKLLIEGTFWSPQTFHFKITHIPDQEYTTKENIAGKHGLLPRC